MRALLAGMTAAALLPLTAVTATAATTLSWRECPGGGGVDGMECATLSVPLDWANPQGRQVTLMLGRLRADGPAPSVLVNYGGPGAPGTLMLRDRVASPGQQPFDRLRHRMNVVTWDPRGYGTGGLSTPALDWSCLSQGPMHGIPDLPADQAAFDRLVAESRAEEQACRKQDPELFDHMDTAANVRDMEAIRQALGEPQLNLYMGSYGGVYGQSYATRFPSRVRTMVLDGTGDHSGNFQRSQEELARDNQVRMRRFADWCNQNTSCALHGRATAQVWQEVLTQAPIPAPSVHATFNRWTLQQLLAGRLIRSGEQDWGRLATDIAAASRGDASGFAVSPEHPYPSIGYPVSECREWPRLHSYAELASTVARLDRIDPVSGAAGTMVPSLLTCVGWTGSVDNPPTPLPTGVPPLLGVGTWGDFPATERVARRVPGSSTIRHDGPGHELYATGNACVIGEVDRYFLDRVLPVPGHAC
ncbi:hypothetical protein KALB_8018 [Kutzneria albida DSM 43870]|uniref:AB hydrolase-1 domain-containing protein n=2 Tax=Kutzneria TaxID=43356 RepID=W5WKT2_9PSEU|nr:hypothetical protein KALB_8018 [Kutzneria albida DSM 43870]